MSFRDDIVNGLSDYPISNMKIDREHVQNGLPSTQISFIVSKGGNKFNHDFTFAKVNQMDADHIVSVIKSYLDAND